MKYISAKEISSIWGISQRRVATLCSEGRVAGAMMVGKMWIIPENAEKPMDGRCQNEGQVGKPFLKWVGGKGQLLREIQKFYPFDSKNCTKYAEPFVGGGAVLFDVLSKYNLDSVYISDTNQDLIDTYKVIRNNVEEVITILEKLQEIFWESNEEQRKEIYLAQRQRFNTLKEITSESNIIEKSAIMIFLNKTCFNGLYRVNKKGAFNVPMGRYKKPLICDKDNLTSIAKKLEKVNIVCGDYRESINFIDEKTFVYFDPPYRPLTNTSSFTAYTKDLFDDDSQKELANYVNTISKLGAKVLVSNSDPKNIDEKDDFFETLYNNHKIDRVGATRMINSKSSKRGKINELLISNF